MQAAHTSAVKVPRESQLIGANHPDEYANEGTIHS